MQNRNFNLISRIFLRVIVNNSKLSNLTLKIIQGVTPITIFIAFKRFPTRSIQKFRQKYRCFMDSYENSTLYSGVLLQLYFYAMICHKIKKEKEEKIIK